MTIQSHKRKSNKKGNSLKKIGLTSLLLLFLGHVGVHSYRVNSAIKPVKEHFNNVARSQMIDSRKYHTGSGDAHMVRLDYGGSIDDIIRIRDEFLKDNNAFRTGVWWITDHGPQTFSVMSLDPTGPYKSIDKSALDKIKDPVGGGFYLLRGFWGDIKKTDDGRLRFKYNTEKGESKEDIAKRFNRLDRSNTYLEVSPNDIVSKKQHEEVSDNFTSRGKNVEILVKYQTSNNSYSSEPQKISNLEEDLELVGYNQSFQRNGEPRRNSKGKLIFGYFPKEGDTKKSIIQEFNNPDITNKFTDITEKDIVNPHGLNITQKYIEKRAKQGKAIAILTDYN